jgi:hypothetical protein
MPGILVREARCAFLQGAVNKSFGASPYPKSSLAGSNLEWQAAERRTTFFRPAQVAAQLTSAACSNINYRLGKSCNDAGRLLRLLKAGYGTTRVARLG